MSKRSEPSQTQFFTSTPVLLFFFFCSLPRNSSIYRGRESSHGLIITLHRSPRARSVIGDLNSILHRLQQCTQFVVHSLLGILRFRSFPPFNKIETKEGTIYIYIYIYISFERPHPIVSHRYRGSTRHQISTLQSRRISQPNLLAL